MKQIVRYIPKRYVITPFFFGAGLTYEGMTKRITFADDFVWRTFIAIYNLSHVEGMH